MIFETLKKVFTRPFYLFLAFVGAGLLFLFAVWLPNFSLIFKVLGHPTATLSQKINLPFSLIGSIATNFTILSATYTILIAILFGINIALFVYLFRNKIQQIKKGGINTGFFGIISGVFGIGCAACGSLLLTSFLSLIGATAVLGYLPLRGGEFGILGVVLLVVSLCMLVKQIQNPNVCTV